ncbi:bifunctional 2-polyprenyl-6-hydroxyphenol methylase/3-demethylubiquinol 3-O-methyltransferase UbiG [Jiella endophytica]|uniref:Ubiquinone biosynthesis O-methyltransferase n=1 Tax=Jiella endophytica TaxID=2558362 RepID=A0A4Y8R9H3_9HYPH|nr:bifunctional 2-polyprenyl-6-hydroxyphenol methylase/3-demethylubiquinol 3-O-methyltransferase UbiG [Jiella endophytica]TFF18371.1 bifunctional 2-polyprenyl-6-hydroxyphenol methylase/3-demethylubiquinol 3-O-methyltransferase UbiG [Jiella endophytica]
MPDATTIDAGEVERFSRLAREWWNPAGKFKPLHKFNPVRLDYIRNEIATNFARDPLQPKPFEGLSILDIGCGGGLISEPLARLGATVVGADASETNIEVARLHASGTGLSIDYRATTAEAIAAGGETFDVVLALEIVEHVADVDLFLSSCAAMVKPGGLLFVATINRTFKALTFAIVGAEYVLGWLPKGTHQYSKLVRPEEIERPVQAAGLSMIDETGVVYHPLADEWRLSRDRDVNYMLLARRPEV